MLEYHQICKLSYLFGNNKTVSDSQIKPAARTNQVQSFWLFTGIAPILCQSTRLFCYSYPCSWLDHDIYGNVKELVPIDAPTPLGKDVILNSYVDAYKCLEFTKFHRNIGLAQSSCDQLLFEATSFPDQHLWLRVYNG